MRVSTSSQPATTNPVGRPAAPSQASTFWKRSLTPGRQLLFIVLAVLAAHLGALNADFYMDDHAHIEKIPAVQNGRWWDLEAYRLSDSEAPVTNHRNFTYFVWSGVHAAFGFSTVAFHAVTLVLHLACSLALFWVAGALVRLLPAREAVRRRAPLAAALIFAVHPLLTEGVNYAQNASLQFVTLFTLVGVGSLVRLRFTRHPKWLGVTGLCWFLATYSKEVGFIYSGGAFALVVALLVRRTAVAQVSELWRNHRGWALAGGTALVALCAVFAPMLWAIARGPFEAPLWAENFFTQGRVFWKYVALAAWPTRLCADHQLPLSGVGWRDAWSLAGILGVATLVIFAGVAGLRRRSAVLGLVGLLALLPLAARFLYVNKELMVEYRVYPAFPWVALLLGTAWAFLSLRAARFALPVGVALLGGWTLISNVRTVVWFSERSIALDTLRQYPANIRARTSLQRQDYDAGEYQKVLEWRDEASLAFLALQKMNEAALLGRKYEASMPWRGLLCTEHFAALAIAESRSSKEGLDYINGVIARVRAARPEFFEKDGGFEEIVEQVLWVQKTLTEHGAEIDARREALSGPPAAPVQPTKVAGQ